VLEPYSRRDFVFVAALAVCASVARAGGSADAARIASLVTSSDTDFVLVLEPAQPLKSTIPASVFGTCSRFEIRGTFARLKGALPWSRSGLSKSDHVAALHYLRSAYDNGKTVEIGEIGKGFEPVARSEPCIVRSLALKIYEEKGGVFVLSHHHRF
jgi:hypothetical protein